MNSLTRAIHLFWIFVFVCLLLNSTVGYADENTGSEHWAFLPPNDPPLPVVNDAAWCMSPLDRYVLSELELRGIGTAAHADRRILIRRLNFDLVGLPPSVDEVDSFLADSSPAAFARLVDRLLASPHYGERWGRHWLDIVRYADSNGLDENLAFGNAWRYRDYVIAAINSDKPYDQFIIEQLAGDLLVESQDMVTRQECLIATGFLSLGPKVLAEVDGGKMEMDIVDEQIDTFGRALMGITLGCARCHDHKFDPLTTKDYYGLAGIFRSTRTMEHFNKLARWHENSLATAEQEGVSKRHQEEIAKQKKRIKKVGDEAKEKLREAAESGTELPDDLEPLFPAKTQAELKELRLGLAELEKTSPVLPSAMGVTEGNIGDEPVRLRGDHLQQGDIVPRRFPAVLISSSQPAIDTSQSGRMQLAQWMVSGTHPLTSRVMVNRIWRWRFGRGLVATPDNFGRLGEHPVNQDLLDWLSHRFVADRWSVKQLHRRVLLTSTYQLSSQHLPTSAAIDPENRLHWRANVRRLEAEPLRDSLLAASQRLDKTMGGSLIHHVKNREFFFDHTSKDGTTYDNGRRSVYLPIVRNHLYQPFYLFDYSDASVSVGDRPTSTVAPQALFMMNSDLMITSSEALAKFVLDQPIDDRHRIVGVYKHLYGREPSGGEVTRAEQSLHQFEASNPGRESADTTSLRQASWTALCQVLLAANEFVYIR